MVIALIKMARICPNKVLRSQNPVYALKTLPMKGGELW
jgi:hypothetical protein